MELSKQIIDLLWTVVISVISAHYILRSVFTKKGTPSASYNNASTAIAQIADSIEDISVDLRNDGQLTMANQLMEQCWQLRALR